VVTTTLPAGRKVAGHLHRFVDEAAAVVAQVEDEPLGAALLQGGDRLRTCCPAPWAKALSDT
jgi:hypothetical protein